MYDKSEMERKHTDLPKVGEEERKIQTVNPNTGFPLFRNHKIPGFFQDFDAIFQVYFCIGS